MKWIDRAVKIQKTSYSFVLVCAGLASAGCSGDLKIYEGNQTGPLRGIPVRIAQPYEKVGLLTSSSTDEDCDQVNFREIIVLPSEELYYLKINEAFLRKTSFTIKVSDQGWLSEVGYNVESTTSDSVTALNELASTILTATILDADTLARPRLNGDLPPCDSGPIVLDVRPL